MIQHISLKIPIFIFILISFTIAIIVPYPKNGIPRNAIWESLQQEKKAPLTHQIVNIQNDSHFSSAKKDNNTKPITIQHYILQWNRYYNQFKFHSSIHNPFISVIKPSNSDRFANLYFEKSNHYGQLLKKRNFDFKKVIPADLVYKKDAVCDTQVDNFSTSNSQRTTQLYYPKYQAIPKSRRKDLIYAKKFTPRTKDHKGFDINNNQADLLEIKEPEKGIKVLNSHSTYNQKQKAQYPSIFDLPQFMNLLDENIEDTYNNNLGVDEFEFGYDLRDEYYDKDIVYILGKEFNLKKRKKPRQKETEIERLERCAKHGYPLDYKKFSETNVTLLNITKNSSADSSISSGSLTGVGKKCFDNKSEVGISITIAFLFTMILI